MQRDAELQPRLVFISLLPGAKDARAWAHAFVPPHSYKGIIYICTCSRNASCNLLALTGLQRGAGVPT